MNKPTQPLWLIQFGIGLISLLLAFVVNAQKADKQLDILVIESYHTQNAWDASYTRGLNKILGDKYSLKYFPMDTKRLPQTQHIKKAQQAWQVYLDSKPKLVILGDDNALKYMGPMLAKTDTPVVYLGINDNPRYYIKKNRNTTGVLERPLLNRSIVELNKITPLKNVLILFDNSPSSKAVLERSLNAQRLLKRLDISINVMLIANYTNWQQAVLSAKTEHYDAIIVGLYHTLVNKESEHVSENIVIQWTSKQTPLPLFSFWGFTVAADKAIGGYVIYGEDQGEEAAKIVLEIFNGTAPVNIFPRTALDGHLLFSQSQLNKWSLTLPESMNKAATFVD
ncbi:MAG: ABC transporter substrate binding protein [Oceanospirillaceae bacterium]